MKVFAVGREGPCMDAGDPVALGLELLAKIEAEAVPLAEAVDRLETITTDPHLTRTILDAAEAEGLLDREAGVVRPEVGRYVRFSREVSTEPGRFTCRRCGATIGEAHYIELDAGTLGPFGSTCVRYVTGRDVP